MTVSVDSVILLMLYIVYRMQNEKGKDSRLYTQTIFQRPHFQFDTVWLIDHAKL